jgi:hypothetical protein
MKSSGKLYKMDPLNFAENSLPKIEYNEKHPSVLYYIDDKKQYADFKKEFIDYVSADCHAITLDDEILYNSYNDKSVRERLQDDMIRDKIMENPHSLFVNIFRKRRDARVIIYMFGTYPWFIAIYYNSARNLLTVEYYKSQAFISRFEGEAQ